MKDPLSTEQWGPRERLDSWLNARRRNGELGMSERIDFELVKEALTEIDRLIKPLKEIAEGETSDVHIVRGIAQDTLARRNGR